MTILLLLLACTSGVDAGPELALLDLGPDRVSADDADLDLADGESVWFAAEHALPGMSWAFPARSIPSDLWNEALEDSVSDSGSCPYIEYEGADRVYRSDCTSGEGYDWSGTVSEVSWDDEDGVEWSQITYDLRITHDDDSATFTELELEGDVVTAKSDAEGVSTHFQVNVAARLVNYWADRADPLHEDTFSDYAMTGWAEIVPGSPANTWTLDLAGRIGSYGTFAMASDGLDQDQDGCEEEPDGTVTLTGSSEATLTLSGSTACDRCVEWDDQKACEP